MTISKSIREIVQQSHEGERRPLWDFLDYVFDQGAKTKGILMGIECMYEAVQDFCSYKGITNIPPFYKYIFEVRGSFTQNKLCYYHSKEWNDMFPNSHLGMANLKIISEEAMLEFQEFQQYLKDNGNDYVMEFVDAYLK